MKELNPIEKKTVEILQRSIDELDEITTPEKFTAWQTRMDLILSTVMSKKAPLIDEICCIEVMSGYTAENNLLGAKEEARGLLKTGIETIELKALKPSKLKKSEKGKKFEFHINNSTQVKQEVLVQIEIELKTILENFKNSLNDKELKELQDIHNSTDGSEKKKSRIREFLKDKAMDLGVALAANPEVWKLFGLG
ncbi:hypothetical protein D3C87_40080 [compost metagenome]